MSTLIHYATEQRTYTMDFSLMDEVVSGDTITTVNSVTCSPTGLTFGTPSISGANVRFTVSGGTAGTNYEVICKITTSSAAVIVGTGQLFCPE